MKTTVLTASTALFLIAAAAQAAVAPGDYLGTTEAEIRATLEAQGYVIDEIEIEADEIEVEAMFDGAEVEIAVSATGEVLEIAAEDADDDDQDDDDDDDDDEDEDGDDSTDS